MLILFMLYDDGADDTLVILTFDFSFMMALSMKAVIFVLMKKLVLCVCV